MSLKKIQDLQRAINFTKDNRYIKMKLIDVQNGSIFFVYIYIYIYRRSNRGGKSSHYQICQADRLVLEPSTSSLARIYSPGKLYNRSSYNNSYWNYFRESSSLHSGNNPANVQAQKLSRFPPKPIDMYLHYHQDVADEDLWVQDGAHLAGAAFHMDWLRYCKGLYQSRSKCHLDPMPKHGNISKT